MQNKFNKQKRASVAEVLNECQVDRSSIHGIPTWRNLSTDAACNKNIKTKYSNLLPDGTVEGTCFDGSALPDIETTKSLLSKLCEVMIRFDANPKFYLKGDFAKLIELLNGALIHLYTNELKVDTNDKILDVDDENNISSTLSLAYNPENETVCLLGKNGDIIASIDVDDLINKKQDKDLTAVANNVAIFNTEGNTVDSKTRIGGSVLNNNPDGNTLATEQAVQKAIDDIEIQVAENDPLLKVNNQKKLFSTINLKHDSINHELQLLGQNNVILARVPTLDFIKDSVLDTASFGFYIKRANEYIPSTSTDPDALPYVVLTFNTDAGKTPIYLSFNDLVSYTIDAAKEQLWAELQKYVDETKEELQKYVDESTEELQKYIDETKEELNNSTDLKASKVKENNTKDKIAILTADGDLQNSKIIIGNENFQQIPIVRLVSGEQYYYVNISVDQAYTNLTGQAVYSDMRCSEEIGKIEAHVGSSRVTINIDGVLQPADIITHPTYVSTIAATELGVKNYITSYVSTQKDINNILNIIP